MEKDFICFEYENATHRLILLHGWGADAQDLIPLGEELSERLGFKLDLLALRAPEIQPNSFGRQWYGLFPPQWSEVPNALKALEFRLQEIPLGRISFSNTFLLGFSQGGAMALATGDKFPFAGLIGCSAYPHPDWNPGVMNLPVFLTHGDNDEVVPLEASQKLLKIFKKTNCDCELYIFNGAHEINQNAISNICSFIKGCID